VKDYPTARNLKFAHEDEILGTGGCHLPLAGWRGESNLVVYNPDVIADIDLRGFIAQHNRSPHLASMVVLEKVPEGKPGLQMRGGKIFAFDAKQAASGAGYDQGYGAAVYILGAGTRKYFPSGEKSFSIIPVLESALAAGESIGAFPHRGIWYDMGDSVAGYLQSQLTLLQSGDPEILEALGVFDILKTTGKHGEFPATAKPDYKLHGPVLRCGEVTIGADCEIGPHVVLCHGAEIGAGARLRNAVVLENAKIAAGADLDGVIATATGLHPTP